jgi:hypothetical protein
MADERDLLAERDQLMAEVLHEGDVKARQAKQDRVDEIQAKLKQAPIYGSKGKK